MIDLTNAKPIIFSTEMVRAILDDRKTMTRRVIKPQPNLVIQDEKGRKPIAFYNGEKWVKCRYQPGDYLWVRETFCEVPYEHDHIPIEGGYVTTPKYAYKADSRVDYTGIWRPSIYMPKAAARLFLRVTDVSVERLQDITEGDARAEGVGDPYDYQDPAYYEQPQFNGIGINKCAFAGLWDSLNAKRGFPYVSNPRVRVISFEREKTDA